MAKFEQGQEKTGGREPGTPNRITNEVKKPLADFIRGKMQPEALERLYQKLRPNEQANFLTKSWAYLMPRMEHHHLEVENITNDKAREILLALLDNDSPGDIT